LNKKGNEGAKQCWYNFRWKEGNILKKSQNISRAALERKGGGGKNPLTNAHGNLPDEGGGVYVDNPNRRVQNPGKGKGLSERAGIFSRRNVFAGCAPL